MSKKGGSIQGPWSGQFQEMAKGLIPLYGQFAQGYRIPGVDYGASPLENQAAQGLSGFNPASYFSGALGAGGGRPFFQSGVGNLTSPSVAPRPYANPDQWNQDKTVVNKGFGGQDVTTRYTPAGAAGGTQAAGPGGAAGGAGGAVGGKGGKGGTGQGAGSVLSQGAGNTQAAAGLVGADPFGASNPLRAALSPDWLNVMQDPAIQARNQALTQGALQQIAGAMPQVNAGVQAATGGAGLGSALMQQRNRMATGVLGGLNQQLAQLGGEDLARREASQQMASQFGMGLPTQWAQTLGNLGLGQLGVGADIGRAMMEGQLAGYTGMGNLGNILQTRQIGGGMAPYQLGLDFLTAARGQPVQGSGGFAGQILQGLGGVGSGVGAIMAA